MLKKNFKQEQGRSMVEMLGVLAVIGVLSVAGIAGYTSAMNQHKANEIVNATSVLYMMAQSQKQGQGDNMNYTNIGAAPTGTSQIAYDNTTKAITITFTDTDLCPPVKNKLGDKADECSEGSLTVTFGGTASEENTTSQAINLEDSNRPQAQNCEENAGGFLCDCSEGWIYLVDIGSFCISADTEAFIGKCFTSSEMNTIIQQLKNVDSTCDCVETSNNNYICNSY